MGIYLAVLDPCHVHEQTVAIALVIDNLVGDHLVVQVVATVGDDAVARDGGVKDVCVGGR